MCDWNKRNKVKSSKDYVFTGSIRQSYGTELIQNAGRDCVLGRDLRLRQEFASNSK